MNPEVKAEFVAALRSGEYKQGNGVLHETDKGVEKFCCLGVLCDLAVKAGVPVDVVVADNGLVEYDGDDAFLPESVQKWSGMRSSDGVYDAASDTDYSTLVGLNDSGHSFTEIADVIEAKF